MKSTVYSTLIFSLAAMAASAHIAAQTAVCPVSSRFAVYKAGSISFEHPDNWIPYQGPRVFPIFGFNPDRNPAVRMGPSQDLGEFRPSCGLQIRAQDLPAPGGAGGEGWMQMMSYLSSDVTGHLSNVSPSSLSPHSNGEVRIRVHLINGGTALAIWNVRDDLHQRFFKQIAFETSRRLYLIDVIGPDGNDPAMDAAFNRLIGSLAMVFADASTTSAPSTPSPNTPRPPEPRPQTVGTPRCPAADIAGDWAGVEVTDRLVGIDAFFTFKPDGTYNYFAGQGNAPWLTQSGVFQISDTGDQRYPCKISLTPDKATIQITSPAHLFALQSRDLMDDKPRTFMYKFFPTATHLMLAGTWTDWHNDIGTVGLDRR
jgi:hypothetical protein